VTRDEQRPRWQHSDDRPYDSTDLGFTRFVDAADTEIARRPARTRRWRSTLRALARFRHVP